MDIFLIVPISVFVRITLPSTFRAQWPTFLYSIRRRQIDGRVLHRTNNDHSSVNKLSTKKPHPTVTFIQTLAIALVWGDLHHSSHAFLSYPRTLAAACRSASNSSQSYSSYLVVPPLSQIFLL
mmetsp:Transcript_1195/g.3350  ORF Transcript_1195/g.3350 Transcript_1195/m.3350 type:complete len:123 (-) Transcript_1195:126-494(-)